ncbi:DNA cross-link repair 1A protein isoform X2 [Channa argus]|uniref:DNA cross-link repair 1A protein isoform X2 n=1 Tax=Channa argus TaxID=215402 RepID=UPI003520D2FA
MSKKDDSENDIWDYKPLGKKTKRHNSPSVTVPKRTCTLRKTPKRDKSPARNVRVKAANREKLSNVTVNADGHGSVETKDTVQRAVEAEGPFAGDFCPVCQMPFSILVVQTQRWHVTECLDIPRDKCQECPDGLQCSSTIPNHFKKFNHTLLAHSRANSDTAFLTLSNKRGDTGETSLSCLPEMKKNEVDSNSSHNSGVSFSALPDYNASPHNNHTGTPLSKFPNGLLLLRSPGPEDCKKKKGWSCSTKGQKSINDSQEYDTELSSTPVKTETVEQTCETFQISELSHDNNNEISYSPLSEFPAEKEVHNSDCRKALFNEDAFKNKGDDSMVLFSDGFSSEDEVLTQFIDNLDTTSASVKVQPSTNTQLESVTSLVPTNQLPAYRVNENRAHSTGNREVYGKATSKCCTQSPQSVVLDRLRENLLNSGNLHSNNLNDNIQSEPVNQVSSTQTSNIQRSRTMPAQKTQSKAGQTSCLKQTDIGVFFGIKPLKEKEKEAENAASVSTLGQNSGQRRQRRDRQRTSKADTTVDNSLDTVTADSSDVANAQGEAWTNETRGWRRRRRNQGTADEKMELPLCPFYKKIPGTKFVIDAFRYGAIKGITAYFLTHFHSDHYGGLTKNSTFPIYCNRITGNLVKSKLKVAEQYVHILPMNTQVVVEGVGVILLEANHCPGAAMLLFLLPDGQVVLHTGDFRADPSMETYPELLSCRVQTLYLDTTYCSPEYTFPRQQEVINFAASTAFELVTLSPRTLVVCGSYSVGKEKVFLGTC